MRDVAEAFRIAVERTPNRVAIGGDQPMTYAQWDQRVGRLATVLCEYGVRRGDRVALLLPSSEAAASAHLAIQRLGGVTVPLSTRFGVDELRHCLRDSEAGLFLCAEDLADRAESAVSAGGAADDDVGEWALAVALLPFAELTSRASRATATASGLSAARRDPDDTSILLYTSGTTGPPKGVPRSHLAELAATTAHIVQTGLAPGHTVLGVMPLFHTMGVRSLLASVLCSGTWVPQERFDTELSIELIRRHRIDTLYLVPTIYWSLIDDLARVGHRVTHLASAGARLGPDLAAALGEAVRPERFVNHLGSTEIYTFAVEPEAGRRPDRVGHNGLYSRTRVIATGPGAGVGDIIGRGGQGQLLVSMSSPEAFAGYRHRPEADLAAIQGGWYHTGDLVQVDDRGDYQYLGRTDDMINSGGEKVYPGDIEDVLSRCPAVVEVVVRGVAHERWGEAVTAFVVPAPGVDPETAEREVVLWAATCGLSSLRRPKQVVCVSEIPRSAVGKILRRVLAA